VKCVEFSIKKPFAGKENDLRSVKTNNARFPSVRPFAISVFATDRGAVFPTAAVVVSREHKGGGGVFFFSKRG